MKNCSILCLAMLTASMLIRPWMAQAQNVEATISHTPDPRTQATDTVPQLPPAIRNYLQGPPAQSKQFDFLIGEWDTTFKRFAPDGATVAQGRGEWRAQHKFGGRMVEDEYVTFLPDGREISSFITLRTWSPQTEQWEMATLSSHTPAGVTSFSGRQVGGEMHLQISGVDPATGKAATARVRFFNITADGFEWEQLNTADGGATWFRGVLIVATRKRAPTTKLPE